MNFISSTLTQVSLKIISITILTFLVSFVAYASLEQFYKDNFTTLRTKQTLNDPELIGPDQLCNSVGSVIGIFSGGGDADTDVYKWTVLSPQGDELFTRPPGAFQTIQYTFELIGAHKIKLEVIRLGVPIANFEKEVLILKSPIITLVNNYKICVGQSIDLQAISPLSENFSKYIFEWKNENNVLVGGSNTLTVYNAGLYTVTFYIPNQDSTPTCLLTQTTTVELLASITILKSAASVCKSGFINFSSEPATVGEWLLTIPGQSTTQSKGRSSELTLIPGIDLPAFGQYSLEFIVENPDNPNCSPSDNTSFTYSEEPLISIISATGSSGCFNPDGALILKAETSIDQLIVDGVGFVYGPFSAGETIQIPNLEAGLYTMFAYLNDCQNTIGTVVPLDVSPSELEFTIEDILSESCTPTGKIQGSFDVRFTNGIPDGDYRVLNEKGDEILTESLPTENPFKITLGAGRYFLEISSINNCDLPNNTFVEIPGKIQTNFRIPETLTICQTYELVPETTESLLFTLTDPLGNETEKKSGEAFIITEAGQYSLLGVLPDQNEICPSERTFIVDTSDPIEFDPILKSEDCIIGNRVFEAEIYASDPDKVNYFWRNSDGNVIGIGRELFLSPTSIGTFSLEVQPKNSEICPISPKEFTVEAPVLFVEASIISTKLCEFGPEAIIELITTSPEAVTDIVWRRFDEDGGVVELPLLNNRKTFTTRVGGMYEVSAYSIIPAITKNCELGRVTFQLDLAPDKVEFTIPEQLTICDFHELVPQTSQDLQFFLTTPSGAEIEKPSGQSFTLEEAGTYTFLASDSKTPSAYCAEQKELRVTLADAVVFQPTLSEELCDGSRIYQVSISNYDLEDVDITWKDKEGYQLGTGEFLTISTPGNYTLEVQPSGIIPCHITPIFFEVLQPILGVDVTLVADSLCPEAPSAAIRAEADFSSVSTIEWWYTSPTGEQSELVEERGKKDILATNEGTYEVRIYNQIPCLLGYDKALIMRSTDDVRPKVNESFTVCPKYDIAPTIDPGNFATYEWYFGDQLVSSSAVFKPRSIGDYRLIVYSEEGCAYVTEFTTEEECELKVIYPNAIQPGIPDKEFLLYTNYLIDELDLSILNKWGQVIFHCSETNLISEEYTCVWDGTFNGKAIPNGTYAVRINFKNYEKNISKSEFGYILIIE